LLAEEDVIGSYKNSISKPPPKVKIKASSHFNQVGLRLPAGGNFHHSSQIGSMPVGGDVTESYKNSVTQPPPNVNKKLPIISTKPGYHCPWEEINWKLHKQYIPASTKSK